jgi:hypothetical protein
MAKQVPATQQQYGPATVQALRDAGNITYDEWSRNWAYANAVRTGKIQVVHHVHTGTVRHEHVHYDGGKLPKDFGDDW